MSVLISPMSAACHERENSPRTVSSEVDMLKRSNLRSSSGRRAPLYTPLYLSCPLTDLSGCGAISGSPDLLGSIDSTPSIDLIVRFCDLFGYNCECVAISKPLVLSARSRLVEAAN